MARRSSGPWRVWPCTGARKSVRLVARPAFPPILAAAGADGGSQTKPYTRDRIGLELIYECAAGPKPAIGTAEYARWRSRPNAYIARLRNHKARTVIAFALGPAGLAGLI